MSTKKRLTTSATAAAACMLLVQAAPTNAVQTAQNPVGPHSGIAANGTGRGGGGSGSPPPSVSDGAGVDPASSTAPGRPDSSGAGGSPTPSDDSFDLTVMAITDIHGHAYNWDYFRDQPYPQGRVHKLGMAWAVTIIENARKSKPEGSAPVVDNGDVIQGTPLTYVAAKCPQLLQG